MKPHYHITRAQMEAHARSVALATAYPTDAEARLDDPGGLSDCPTSPRPLKRKHTMTLNSLHKYAPPEAIVIATLVVDTALAMETPLICISVNDGEETTLHKSRDRKAILDAMGTTEADILIFYEDDGNGRLKIGGVELIYSNGCEVISDYTDNLGVSILLKDAEKLAESYMQDNVDRDRRIRAG